MDSVVYEYKDGIVFKNVDDFELKHIFDCGQCFRWDEREDGSYVGVAFNRAVRVSKMENDIYIKGGKIEDYKLWMDYFDIQRDYGEIKRELSKDSILKEAITHGEGIRILNQDPFETTISFIISANNRIPMIKRAVNNISKRFGQKIEFEGNEYYGFPDADTLAAIELKDIAACGCGFRAPYIIETARDISMGKVELSNIKKMDTDAALKELIKLKGVGNKVADCIMLFSMGKSDAFPVDVWVKRVMEYFYLAPDISLKGIREYGRGKFNNLAGFAQQYLFYYARDLKGREGFKK